MSFEIFSSVRIVVAFGAEAKLARRHEEMLVKVSAHHNDNSHRYVGLFYVLFSWTQDPDSLLISYRLQVTRRKSLR